MTTLFDGFTFLSAGVTACGVWLSFLVIKTLRIGSGRDRWDAWAVAAAALTLGSLAVFAYGLTQGWAARDTFSGPGDIGTVPWLALRWLLVPGVWMGILVLPMLLWGVGQRLDRPVLRNAMAAGGVVVILALANDPRLLGLALASAMANLALHLYDDQRRVVTRKS